MMLTPYLPEWKNGTRESATRAGTESDAHYSPDDVDAAARARCRSATRSPRRAPSASGTLLNSKDYVNALGALTGNQAMQHGASAGLEAIYLSGWQVRGPTQTSRGRCTRTRACTRRTASRTLVKRINPRLQRADQIAHSEGDDSTDWFAPIVADAEAGFGGPLNAFELMKGMIEAGAAGVHFEDQLASEKKCGHLGGKVLVPTQEASSAR